MSWCVGGSAAHVTTLPRAARLSKGEGRLVCDVWRVAEYTEAPLRRAVICKVYGSVEAVR